MFLLCVLFSINKKKEKFTKFNLLTRLPITSTLIQQPNDEFIASFAINRWNNNAWNSQWNNMVVADQKITQVQGLF